MIVSSRVIVVGEVQSVKYRRDPVNKGIYTYVEVNVLELIKGQLKKSRVVLKQIGGTVGNKRRFVSGAPEFNAGERVLLFLNTSSDGTLRVAHLFMRIKG